MVVPQSCNYQSHAYAIFPLKSLLGAVSPMCLLSLEPKLFQGLGRNQIKAVEACRAPVLVNLLLNVLEKRVRELTLVVLDQLCGCTEGRTVLLVQTSGMVVVQEDA
ncbi:hypothetical protein Taro_045104 [Colocasia esculenta]|uniref:Uncharacterized protein n=1 Tax=Colocasia esculenta TaxID=4460 RepID=A0A843WL31_COLES|nr:hypothetical protein [Colocasia esculenta]